MRRFVASFARNRVFANILLLTIMVVGGLASFIMIRELFPPFSVDIINVSVAYPGADPEEVEEGISRKIEEAIDGLEGIKQYTTMSRENVSGTTIEVEEGWDTGEVKDRVRNAVDSISNMPDDAEEPIVEEVIRTDEVILVGLAGDLPERTLKEWAKGIEEELRQLPEISRVEISGTRDYEISIEISEEMLEQYGLSFDQVTALVRQNSINMGGGVMRTKGEEIRVRTIGRKYTGGDYADIVVLGEENITLDRIATIHDDFVEDPLLSRFNGKPGVLLSVIKTEEEDAIKMASAVKDYVDQRSQTLPSTLEMRHWADRSSFIEGRINLLVRNGLIGLTLVFFLLWLFLDLRLSFWAGMGIPISLAGALGLMWFLGSSLNMINLFALIMVLGIIVDDAIVVGEAIYVHRKAGEPPLQAAVEGVMEVGMPVIAAVTTSIVAFMPLFYVGGIMGKFIAIMPVAVISALAVSLVECLVLLPAHLSDLPDINTPRKNRIPVLGRILALRRKVSEGLETFAEKVYLPFVRATIRWRYVGLSVAIAFLMVTAGLFAGGFFKMTFFPNMDGNDLMATVQFPQGTPVAVTERAVSRMESALERVARQTDTKSGDPLIENTFASVGMGAGMGASAGSHVGSVRVELLDSELRGVSTEDLKVAWQKEIGGIVGADSLRFEGMRAGPPGAPIEIWAQGENMDQLIAASEDIEEKLAEFEGVYQIRSDFQEGKKEFRLRMKDEGRALGLTTADLARQIYAGYFGQEAVRLQRGEDDVRVRVRYPEEKRNTASEIEDVRIRTPDGREIPLFAVADVELEPGYSTILRTDGRRRVSVMADVDDNRANAQEILGYLQREVFPELKQQYAGITLSQQGQQRDNREALSTLFVGYPVALLGIYVIIATMFRSYAQPFVIMFTVPFGLLGAVYAHAVMGYHISLISMFGMVALAGVVVNDAIVLIECINGFIARGMPFHEALARGGVRRFRAIVLTTATTVGGLTPMILETDLQARFLIPMALSIAGGVLFATMLTLLLEPCLLGILNDLKRLVRVGRQTVSKVWNPGVTVRWPTPEEVEPATERYREPEGVPAGEPAPAES